MPLPSTDLTLHLDASTNAEVYTTNNPGGAPSGNCSNGDPANVWRSTVNTAHLFRTSSINSPIYKTDGVMGLPSIQYDPAPIGNSYSHYAMDSNSNPFDIDTFFDNNKFTVLCAFHIENNPVSNAAASYQNCSLLGDVSQYFGIFFKAPGGGLFDMLGYNWDGSDDKVTIAITVGVNHVVMFRHESGNLYMSLDGGSESTVASGNTQVMSGQMFLARFVLQSFATQYSGRIGELAVYNAALTGTDLSDAIDYFMTKWVTPPSAGLPNQILRYL